MRKGEKKNSKGGHKGDINEAFDHSLESLPDGEAKDKQNDAVKTTDESNYKDHSNIFINERELEKAGERDLTKDEDEEEDEDGDFGFFNFFESFFEEDTRTIKIIKKLRMSVDIRQIVTKFLPIVALILYFAYLVAVIVIHSEIENNSYWCDGDGFLYVWTLIVATVLLYSQIVKKYFSKAIYKGLQPLTNGLRTLWDKRVFRTTFLLVLIVVVVAFYIVDTANQRRRLVSFIGLFVIVFFGFLFSRAPQKVVWRFIIWGLSVQFVLALCVLRWPLGNSVLQCLSSKVSKFLAYSLEGAIFVFGPLAKNPSTIFAFTVLPVTIFFSFCTNILYYYGAIQWLVIKVGWLFQVTVGTNLCESMSAAGSIFLGLTEAPLLVKPYLSLMTKSELHTIMAAGFATIAGSVMAAYISLGADPVILLTASVMNAPAALALSKLLYPNIRKTRITIKTIEAMKSTEVNALHAGCVGVSNAIPLVANIAANLIAFIAFISFFNAIFDWTCQLVNYEEGTCSLEGAFGYIFMPLAWVMGVKWSDCFNVGQLIGLKIVINEFVAYTKLSEFINSNQLSDRSVAIATFALCGFGNFGGVGIMMGGLGPLAPDRKDDLATVAFRAMITGSMATFSSACIAGTLLSYSDMDKILENEGTTMMPNITLAGV